MRGISRSLIALLAVVSLASGCGYNKLQTLDETVNKAEGHIKVQLQRRADLIGNLVEVVKGVAKQESTVFIGVAEARSKLATAASGGNLSEMAAANGAMAAPLARLMAVAEAYPELKSSANFTLLQDQIEGTENRVAVARTDYNTAVGDLNTTARQFPTNLTAKLFGLGKPRPYFDVTTPGAEEAPKVKF